MNGGLMCMYVCYDLFYIFLQCMMDIWYMIFRSLETTQYILHNVYILHIPGFHDL